MAFLFMHSHIQLSNDDEQLGKTLITLILDTAKEDGKGTQLNAMARMWLGDVIKGRS